MKILLKSGSQKTLLLSKDEIFNLSAAIINRAKTDIFTFHYDGVGDKLSGIIDLLAIEYVDIDDRELSAKELDLIDYNKFRIWKEPSFFRKLYFKIKWFFGDRKKGN